MAKVKQFNDVIGDYILYINIAISLCGILLLLIFYIIYNINKAKTNVLKKRCKK